MKRICHLHHSPPPLDGQPCLFPALTNDWKLQRNGLFVAERPCLYSSCRRCLKSWNSPIRSFNFFLNAAVIAVRVLSDEDPGPQPCTQTCLEPQSSEPHHPLNPDSCSSLGLLQVQEDFLKTKLGSWQFDIIWVIVIKLVVNVSPFCTPSPLPQS